MSGRIVLTAFLAVTSGLAQQVCSPTPTYTPCDIVFELNDQEAAAHSNPYVSVDIRAELRSPKARTILMPAFWDGGRRMVIRFSPIDAGNWDFRISSNLQRFDGKLGQVQATESADPGFLRPANVHHWMYSETRKAHLWMGDTFLDFPIAPQPTFEAYLEARSQQKFNHVRGLVLGKPGEEKRAFTSAEMPVPAFFQQLDQRMLALGKKGIFTDLVLAHDGKQLMDLFPGWKDRERFLRYVVARYAAMHLTWQLMAEFESYADSRAVMKDLGTLIKSMDPYQHPRSTGTTATSAPALPDGWMNFVQHESADDAIGAIEHHVFPTPFVNSGFAKEADGADNFRKRLWNATMNGQYPSAILNSANPDSASSKVMAGWYDFFARTRWWELEPHYDVDGGRALALPGVEYIVYVEKSDHVEILVEKHNYDVYWYNPVTGELIHEKKDFKGEKWAGEPPNKSQDWVLHLSRDGHKEGMRSWKFESRPNVMQEIEQNPQKMPFEIIEPVIDTLQISKPPKYAIKLKRETRGTREMRYLWTGEVPTELRGYRVLGTGANGTLRIPAHLAKIFPAVFNIRLYALNAVGKVYAVDKVFRLSQ
ncbi:MAG TPA: DUF5060 domain-containing protein [Bryobacteraceae bacterium]|nr:DUF5060 domain-containing protein [Bryobacteraceae bacterium]